MKETVKKMGKKRKVRRCVNRTRPRSLLGSAHLAPRRWMPQNPRTRKAALPRACAGAMHN